ncbi:MAG TPA: hypothetical protein VFQ70_03015 [Candidatus Saccharimonadaceae bacterium]|nr:hypothetical protein [Candidatus Saccharimonadaceae bacterium]
MQDHFPRRTSLEGSATATEAQGDDERDKMADKLGSYYLASARLGLPIDVSRVSKSKSRQRSAPRRRNPSKVIDGDSSYDPEWNVARPPLDPDQHAINVRGKKAVLEALEAACRRPNEQPDCPPKAPFDTAAFQAVVDAGWRQVEIRIAKSDPSESD